LNLLIVNFEISRRQMRYLLLLLLQREAFNLCGIVCGMVIIMLCQRHTFSSSTRSTQCQFQFLSNTKPEKKTKAAYRTFFPFPYPLVTTLSCCVLRFSSLQFSSLQFSSVLLIYEHVFSRSISFCNLPARCFFLLFTFRHKYSLDRM